MALVVMAKTTMPWSVKSTVSMVASNWSVLSAKLGGQGPKVLGGGACDLYSECVF
jgi:hypothetical protein